MTTHQVIIVGGGPVGLGLAIELGQRGVKTCLVERYKGMHKIPKGQNLTQRSMEHLVRWGAEKQLRAARTVPATVGIGGLTAYGTLLSDYHYDWLQRELVRPFYYTDNERLPQYETELVLRRRLADVPNVETLYGWQVEEVVPTGDTVAVRVVERGGPSRRWLRSDYVAGCDGARSIVRDRAGIAQTLTDHDRLMVLLVFKSPDLHKLLERYSGKSYFAVISPELKGYWQFFGRVDYGTTWFFHSPVPAGTRRDNYDFAAHLHRAVGAKFAIDFDHIGFWDLRFALADTYRNGRIFIAGDACHTHPPYGGYGVNSGWEDARNLGWKLAASLQGWAGEALLDSYTEERQPVFGSTIRNFIGHSILRDRDFLAAYNPTTDKPAFEKAWADRISGAPAEVGAFEPNYEGSPVVFGPPGGKCSAVGEHTYDARPGHHLAPTTLNDGRNVFEALGSGFTLLALDADPAPFEAAAASLNIPLTVLRDTRTDGRERYDAGLVLIRPDEFVAWAGDSVQDAAVLLSAAAGDLRRFQADWDRKEDFRNGVDL